MRATLSLLVLCNMLYCGSTLRLLPPWHMPKLVLGTDLDDHCSVRKKPGLLALCKRQLSTTRFGVMVSATVVNMAGA